MSNKMFPTTRLEWEENQAKRQAWEKQVAEWWEANDIPEFSEDPPGEVMYDAFAFIEELMKIRKEDK